MSHAGCQGLLDMPVKSASTGGGHTHLVCNDALQLLSRQEFKQPRVQHNEGLLAGNSKRVRIRKCILHKENEIVRFDDLADEYVAIESVVQV